MPPSEPPIANRRPNGRSNRCGASRPLVAVLAGLALLLLLECALALGGFRYDRGPDTFVIWAPREDEAMRLGRGMHEPALTQLWRPRPGAELPWGHRESISRDGIRGRTETRARSSGFARLAALGDSSTFGLGVAQDQTWPALLEWLLAGRGHQAEVLNAGVIDFTLEQGLWRYRELVRPYHPDVVIAAFGAVNEAIQSRGMPDRAKIERGLSRGWLRRACDAFLARSRTGQLGTLCADRVRGIDAKDRQRALQEWNREQRGLELDAGQVDWTGTRRVELPRFGELLDQLASEVRADGAVLVLVAMPRNPEEDRTRPVLLRYTEAVLEAARRLDVPVLDAHRLFLDLLEQGHAWEEYFLDSYDPSAEGQEILARKLLELVTPILASVGAKPAH
jgi:lysophospholipase L1-like esterase